MTSRPDDELLEELKKRADLRMEGGTGYQCLSLETIKDLSLTYRTSVKQVSILALQNGMIPLRYIKNIGTIGVEGQAKLLTSSVLIVGVGGIGGRVAELLTRMGVGLITLVDPDVFDESNLNRQDFSSEETLGKPKVEVVSRRISDINSDVETAVLELEGSRESLGGPVKDADLVIDALDNIDDRLELEALCGDTGSIMIHGAIAGDYLQAMTVYPGDPGLASFMRRSDGNEKSRGIETETGNPSTTPTIAASIQAHEAISILSGRGPKLRGKLLYMDLDIFTVDFIDLQ